jgi:hypothetical protein
MENAFAILDGKDQAIVIAKQGKPGNTAKSVNLDTMVHLAHCVKTVEMEFVVMEFKGMGPASVLMAGSAMAPLLVQHALLHIMDRPVSRVRF